MRKTVLLATITACASAGSLPAPAQDNTPPVIVSVTWEISRNVTGDPSFFPSANWTWVPFDPWTELAWELDWIRITVEVFDPDFDGEEGDGIHFVNQTLWLPVPGYWAPEPPPITDDRFVFFPEEDGLKPVSGTTLEFSIYFQIPSFQGENQAHLRGLIDYDVAWMFHLLVSNEQDPSCGTSGEGLVVQPCENPVDEWNQFFFAVQNPALIPPNPPPFADAGADRLVEAGTITLDGSRTLDAYNIGFNVDSGDVFDKDTLTFTWEWVSGPVRADPVQSDPSDPTATVTLAAPGDYVFRLIVDDNVNALPSTDSVTITVGTLADRNPPRAVIRGPATPVPVGTIVTLTSESTDPDGDELEYRWQQTDELGGALPAEDLHEVFQPLSGMTDDTASWQALKAGTYYVRLLVDDGYFRSSARFSVQVIDTVTSGASVTADSGSNDDGGATPGPALCGAGALPLAALPLALCLMRRRMR
ncbi:MAG: PKD domain-containing protein [Planctomycetes bacterium]|nr:PKD domain-containing protein [Planctomycetota bacterium]